MKNILVSGLISIETNVKIDKFPIKYSPVEYNFFGTNTAISGVGFNVIKAIKTLGGNPVFFSITGNDLFKNIIKDELKKIGIDDSFVLPLVNQTSQSIIFFNEYKRKIILDLKNIQETKYPAENINKIINEIDIAILCNINFSREMLKIVKDHGKIIATDVHVLDNLNDEYNKDFIYYSDILFLSNENIKGNEQNFLTELVKAYNHKIIVISMGENGLLIFTREDIKIKHYPAIRTRDVVNTIGAGDALFSAFIYFYNKTKNAHYSIEKAIIFASYKIGESGGAEGFLSEEELLIEQKSIENSCGFALTN